MSESPSALGREVSGYACEGLLIVGAVALAAVAVAVSVGDAWLATALALLAPPLIAIAVVDARTHRIPISLTLATLAVATVTVGGRALTLPEVGVRAVVAAVVIGLLYLVLWRFADLGLGDVKLAATLALIAGWSGWQAVVAFVVLAHLLPVPFAVWRVVRRRRDRIAFGPALVVGPYAAVALTALAR